MTTSFLGSTALKCEQPVISLVESEFAPPKITRAGGWSFNGLTGLPLRTRFRPPITSILALAVATIGTLAFLTRVSEGASITSFGPGTNTASGGGSQINGDFVGDDTVPDVLNVTLNLDVYAKSEAGFTTLADQRFFDTNFSTKNTTTGPTTKTYNFSVTINNHVGEGIEDPLQPAAAGKEIQNIEFGIVKPSGIGLGGLTFATPANNPPGGPIIFTRTVGGVTETVLRFGGLDGGGVAIPPGDSHTYNFQITIPNRTGGTLYTWQLRTTANPEPTSLALGGLGIFIVGGIGFARSRWNKRKRTKMPESPATQ